MEFPVHYYKVIYDPVCDDWILSLSVFHHYWNPFFSGVSEKSHAQVNILKLNSLCRFLDCQKTRLTLFVCWGAMEHTPEPAMKLFNLL